MCITWNHARAVDGLVLCFMPDRRSWHSATRLTYTQQANSSMTSDPQSSNLCRTCTYFGNNFPGSSHEHSKAYEHISGPLTQYTRAPFERCSPPADVVQQRGHKPMVKAKWAASQWISTHAEVCDRTGRSFDRWVGQCPEKLPHGSSMNAATSCLPERQGRSRSKLGAALCAT